MKFKQLLTSIIVMLSMSSIHAKQSIVIFSNDSQPPKSYKENGAPKGYTIEETKQLLDPFDIELVIELVPFARAMEETKKCKGLMTGVYYTEQRSNTFAYSKQPLPTADEAVVLYQSNGSFSKVEDFIGKNIGYLRGGIAFGEKFDNLLADNKFFKTESNDMEQLIKMLSLGRTDFVIFTPSRQRAQQIVSNLNISDKVNIANVPLIKNDNYLIGCKAKQEFYRQKFNGIF